jgi:hypothetical protein
MRQGPLEANQDLPRLSEGQGLPLSARLSHRSAVEVVERLEAEVPSFETELFLDADELVVLGDTVGARGGTGLDLAAVGCDGDVSDGRVFGCLLYTSDAADDM